MAIDLAHAPKSPGARGTHWGRGALTLVLAVAVLGALTTILTQQSAAAPAMGTKRVYFRIAAGVVSGSDFQMGEAIARVLSRPNGDQPCDPGVRCGVTGVTAVATASEGPVANVQLLSTGHVESALIPADIASWASQGTGPFERTGALPGLRVVATLFPEAVHLIAANDAHIKSVADLKGKRVAVDAYLGGANTDAHLILKAFGLGPHNVKLVEIGPEVAADKIATGELDAFFVTGGWPIPLVQDLAKRVPITLVPIRGPAIERVMNENPLLFPVSVPDKLYGDLPAVETLGVDEVWVTWSTQPEGLVYVLTTALWSPGNRSTLTTAHMAGSLIRLVDAASRSPIPLHPGAERYYREHGVLGPPTGALPPSESVPIPRIRPAIAPAQAARQ